uniref:IS3 family transposase n=1 Tax=Alicyclobacillus tolerans TaxID=90970 RepID=UPI001F010822
MVERENEQVPLRTQANLLSLSRSSLYYKPVGPSQDEVKLKHQIDEIYTAHPTYGSRKIVHMLRREGWEVNRKRVQRCMREMGIEAIYPGPNLSKRNLQHKIYPYLLRNVTPNHPNHVFGIDITYIRLKHGWMYLVAVIDWYSRYIVSWQLSDTLELPFVLTAVRSALKQAKPKIWNSDQGSHFTSDQYISLLKEAEVQISMDGKNRALDNIITERFWRTLKYDHVYLHEYNSPKEARQKIGAFIQEYNYDRPHQSLSYLGGAEPRCYTECTANDGHKISDPSSC